MPDYAVVKSLCEELKVTVSELMDGEEAGDKSVRAYDDEQILDLLRRTQELEKQKASLEQARKMVDQEEDIMGGIQESQMEKEISQAPVLQPGERVRATLSGIIVPLGPNANEETTHALCRKENGRYVPEAYLRAERFSLKDWEGQVVEVSGLQERKRGWSRPLLVVSGIVLK